jgi:hypothetical protein
MLALHEQPEWHYCPQQLYPYDLRHLNCSRTTLDMPLRLRVCNAPLPANIS